MDLSRLFSAFLIALALMVPDPGLAQGSFVTFESGQVRPISISPDGLRLFAVNTPDNRLEIFDVSVSGLTHTGSVPVGMEPVTVVARSNTEVWVVNHLSDDISIVARRRVTLFETLANTVTTAAMISSVIAIATSISTMVSAVGGGQWAVGRRRLTAPARAVSGLDGWSNFTRWLLRPLFATSWAQAQKAPEAAQAHSLQHAVTYWSRKSYS